MDSPNTRKGLEVIWYVTEVSYIHNQQCNTPTSATFQLILPNKSAHHNNKVQLKYDYELMRSIEPQIGSTVEYVSEFTPMGLLEFIIFYH